MGRERGEREKGEGGRRCQGERGERERRGGAKVSGTEQSKNCKLW